MSHNCSCAWSVYGAAPCVCALVPSIFLSLLLTHTGESHGLSGEKNPTPAHTGCDNPFSYSTATSYQCDNGKYGTVRTSSMDPLQQLHRKWKWCSKNDGDWQGPGIRAIILPAPAWRRRRWHLAGRETDASGPAMRGQGGLAEQAKPQPPSAPTTLPFGQAGPAVASGGLPQPIRGPAASAGYDRVCEGNGPAESTKETARPSPRGKQPPAEIRGGGGGGAGAAPAGRPRRHHGASRSSGPQQQRGRNLQQKQSKRGRGRRLQRQQRQQRMPRLLPPPRKQ